MKTLVTILALTAAVVASPAFAKTRINTLCRGTDAIVINADNSSSSAAEHARAHVQYPDTFTFDGKVVSQDPDPFIRQQAIRGAESGGANR